MASVRALEPECNASASQAHPLLDVFGPTPRQQDADQRSLAAQWPRAAPRRRLLRWAALGVLLGLLLALAAVKGLAVVRPGAASGDDASGKDLKAGDELLFLARRKFKLISSGTCSEVGMEPITDRWQCENAAREMGMADTSALPVDLVGVPEGCYYLKDSRDGNTGLWLGTNKFNVGNGAETSSDSKGKIRQPICGRAVKAATANAGSSPGTAASSTSASASTSTSASTSASTSTSTSTSTSRTASSAVATTTAGAPTAAADSVESRRPEVPPPPTPVPSRSPPPVVRVVLTGPGGAPAQQEGKHVLKGISYSPTPHRGHRPLAGDDFVSDGAAAMWGRRGRGDLDIIKALGANAVRLYGNNPALGHGKFLDEASELGLEVIAGVGGGRPDAAAPGGCSASGFDCYQQFKGHYTQNLQGGFVRGDKTYHPALRTLVLMNEPDARRHPAARPSEFCRALVSALDAVLDAEREAGVVGQLPNITATFSFGACPECALFGYRPAVGQMLELRQAMQHPESVGYQARNDLWKAYRQRFVNSFNTASAANTLRHQFLDAYHVSFRDTPVFIGEYRPPHQEDLEKDLETVLDLASKPTSLLMGLSFFEFQVRYDAEGLPSRLGIFGLGDESVGSVSISDRQLAARCLSPQRSVRPRLAAAAATTPRPWQGRCGWMEKEVEYEVDAPWAVAVENVTSAEDCCSQCGKEPRCLSWSWGAGNRRCSLKGGKPAGKNRKPQQGFVSGLPPPRFLVAPSSAPGGDAAADRGQGPIALVFASIARAFGGRGISPSQLCREAGGGF